MTKTLKEAMAEITRLPETTQEKIGEDLLLHLDKLRRLRAKIEKGIESLDRGEGRQLDIDDVIRRARANHGSA
jgi:Arc/MetJ-type ribon-helix-helix transcriptional regulator